MNCPMCGTRLVWAERRVDGAVRWRRWLIDDNGCKIPDTERVDHQGPCVLTDDGYFCMDCCEWLKDITDDLLEKGEP